MKQGGVPVRRGDYTVLFHFFTPLRHCTKQNLLLWEYKYSVVANGAVTSRRPSLGEEF